MEVLTLLSKYIESTSILKGNLCQIPRYLHTRITQPIGKATINREIDKAVSSPNSWPGLALGGDGVSRCTTS